MGYFSEEYYEGEQARHKNLEACDNPYAHGSRQADDWLEGWANIDDAIYYAYLET